MYAYRVFVSYSHEDEALVSDIVRLLEGSGLTPMWDRSFAAGSGFHEQIKTYIAHAHVFLPVITEASSKRGWVHEEIGYAMALNIPVLPVAVDALPGEMIGELQAVRMDDGVAENDLRLPYSLFEDRVREYQAPDRALHRCAELADDRARMMADYANAVAAVKLGAQAQRTHALVRQQGGLSSFHIPDKTVDHRDWQDRYGDHPKSPSHCEGQWKERRALEQHAREAGCRIVVDPSLDYAKFGPKARQVRLRCLLDFLESMPPDKVEVAFDTRMSPGYSLTIVGDWFAAEAVAATLGQGFRQTIFTRHAPSMTWRIERFDRRFAELLEESGWDAASSRDAAVREITSIIEGIEA